MDILSDPEESQSRQGRPVGDESSPTIRGEIVIEPLFLLGGRQFSPILIVHRVLSPSMDDLVRLIELGPVNRGPQCRVPRDKPLPGLPEGREVEVAPNPAEELLEVVPGLGVDEGVEEHSFLHRREGIRVLDSPAAGEGALDRLAVNSTGDQIERSDGARQRFARITGLADRLGRYRKLGDGRVPEEVRGFKGQVGLPRPRDNLDAHDGVDAKLEQVIVNADAAPPHEFRHDPGEDLLRGGTRGNVFGLRSVDFLGSRGEGRSIDLAVLREGHRVE